jgi:hypothetical protein
MNYMFAYVVCPLCAFACDPKLYAWFYNYLWKLTH